MRLYDASAIYSIIELGGVIDFDQGATIGLANFEVGNTIWKHYSLKHKISPNDAMILSKTVTIFLRNISQLEPDPISTLKFAIRENVTYYDAAYIVAAIQSQSIFVTEDKKQMEVARKYVSVESVNERLKSSG